MEKNMVQKIMEAHLVSGRLNPGDEVGIAIETNSLWANSMTRTISTQFKLSLFATLVLCPEISIPISRVTLTTKGFGMFPGLARCQPKERIYPVFPLSLTSGPSDPRPLGCGRYPPCSRTIPFQFL